MSALAEKTQAMNYLPTMATIQNVQPMTAQEKVFRCELEDFELLGHGPGQFVEVSIFGIGEAPISISSSPTKKDGFELCVRNAGSVTGALHKLEAGATIGVRGPFGKGFPVDELKGKDILFIAGGLGLAPLRSMIGYVMDERDQFGKVTLLSGSKSPSEILFKDELQSWEARDDVDVQVTVDKADDTWKGQVGVITTLFKGLDIDPNTTYALVVGPPIMYKFVLMELDGKEIPHEQVFMSLERRMKCGLGFCGHCQINDLYVCQDGPVFRYSEVASKREAI